MSTDEDVQAADAVAPPAVELRFGTVLPHGVSREQAFDLWLQYIWREGGGFGPKPQVVEEGEPLTGTGCTRVIRPPGVQEKVMEGKRPHSFMYKVLNPGVFTYQVTFHEGEVTFRQEGEGDQVEMVWVVRYTPMLGFGLLVRAITNYVIGTLISNMGKKAKGSSSSSSSSSSFSQS